MVTGIWVYGNSVTSLGKTSTTLIEKIAVAKMALGSEKSKFGG